MADGTWEERTKVSTSCLWGPVAARGRPKRCAGLQVPRWAPASVKRRVEVRCDRHRFNGLEREVALARGDGAPSLTHAHLVCKGASTPTHT